MWFGTFNGLNRYDGYQFETFHYVPGDSNSISHNYISALEEDRNGYIWIGTRDGLTRLDPKLNQFKTYKHKENEPGSINHNSIEALVEDNQGRIWIGTRNGGLDLYDPEAQSFIHYTHQPNNPNSLSSNSIRELFEDSNGNIWIGHWDGSVDILSFDNTQSEPTIHKNQLADVPITAIVESFDKAIWIASQGEGLFQVKFENGKLIQNGHHTYSPTKRNGISSNIILCLMVDQDDKLWIGTEDRAISILDLDLNTYQFVVNDAFRESSLNHNSIWQIYEDNMGNVWIGTYAHGINLLTDRKSYFHHFKSYPGKVNGLNHNMVTAFVEDNDNNLWIATDGGGLNFFDRKNNTFLYYTTKNSNLGTDVIVSLLKDTKGQLWVGTWTKGLYRFDKEAKTFSRYSQEEHGLGSNRILHITEDRDGGLWLSTYWGGLTYFNPDQSIIKVYNTGSSGLTDNFVRTTRQDVYGNLWIGTDFGINIYESESDQFLTFKHNEDDAHSLSKGFVHCIAQTSDSSIWIGTTGGLNKFDKETNRFIHFNTANGLPNNEIKCIIEEKDGVLWLSTNKGISRLDTKSGIFKNYDYLDGLQGNEFNIRSGLKTSRNEIIFGGNNGFNIFNYPILKENRHIPPVIITDIKIFNMSVHIGNENPPLPKHISEMQEIAISYKHNVLSFDFVALNYVSPEKNKYAYIMEGFETNWNYVDVRRTATYTNLDPGEYIFRVKASNNDGLWNEEGVSLNIVIEPPFWKTWWAYLIELALIIAIIGFVLNYFISRQRLKSALKIEHLQLEKMYEMDQMKTQFFSNIAHEFYSPLSLIISPLQKLLTSGIEDERIKSSLTQIHHNAQRLQRMTNQLKDFQKIETSDLRLSLSRGNIIQFIEQTVSSFKDYADTRHIKLYFNATPERSVEWFDPDKLDKIIYNLLSNAFKFTPNHGRVDIGLSILYRNQNGGTSSSQTKNIRYIEIKVQDNGIGIPKDKIDRIFERFYRAEKDTVGSIEGTGIGLAFVYELVKLYGGEISVSSAEGEGSIFTVLIPLDENYLEENQLVADFNITQPGWDAGLKEGSDLLEAASGKSAAAPTPAVDIPVILVVEDDEEIRNYVQSSLESRYRIITAENGKLGIKKAIKTVPDLVISDVKMPGADGIELCNTIKSDERTSHVPVILLTALSSRESKLEGLKEGADVYLSKPFNMDELEAHIINLLQTRRRLRAKYSRAIMFGSTSDRLKNLDEEFLERTLDIVEKNISNPEFNAELLSQKMNISRMQLYRKLRSLTDQTAHEFIRSIRLKEAARLLKEKRMTITEVAYEVGFNDLTYFARCFRKQFNTSPSEYLSDLK